MLDVNASTIKANLTQFAGSTRCASPSTAQHRRVRCTRAPGRRGVQADKHVLQYGRSPRTRRRDGAAARDLPTLDYSRRAKCALAFARGGRSAAFVAGSCRRLQRTSLGGHRERSRCRDAEDDAPLTFILGPPTQLHAKFRRDRVGDRALDAASR